MSDLTKTGLKGSVKVCSTERIFFSSDQRSPPSPRTELRELSRVSFDAKGNLLELWQRNAGGTEWSAVSEYNRAGRLVETRYAGIQYGSDQAFLYFYDPPDRLARVDARSRTGDTRVYELHTYGPNREAESICYPDPASDRSLGIDATNLHWSPDAVAITTRLDKTGEPMERILYGSDNGIIRRVLFLYDRAGNLIEEGEAGGGNRIRADFRRVYGYDQARRRIRAEIICYPFENSVESFFYNDHDDVIETHTEKHPVDGEDSLSVLRYVYKHDQQYNWIERVTQASTSSGLSFENTGVECRELSYY